MEKTIWEEYDRIKEEGVTKQEVERAKAKIRAETAFSRDGSYSIASHLNEAIALGDWTFYTTYLERVEEVKTEDVQRVSRAYLGEDASTVGYFIPTHTDAGEG